MHPEHVLALQFLYFSPRVFDHSQHPAFLLVVKTPAHFTPVNDTLLIHYLKDDALADPPVFTI
jgi:hypothetical protein